MGLLHIIRSGKGVDLTNFVDVMGQYSLFQEK